MKSKGQPITYAGKTLVMSDRFPCMNAKSLRLVIESCNAEWRQGVVLRILKGSHLRLNGQNVTHAVCWADTAPPIIDVQVSDDVSEIVVYNVWDSGNGVINARHNGAAMIMDLIENGRRYICNDGRPDDDFDDIIFRIERLT